MSKLITDSPDVQGLRILVLSRAMEAASKEPIQAGFLTSISGIKGGTRESQKLSPINDRDYEEINSVGKKTSATVNLNLLYKFVKDGKVQDYEGVHYLEKAFEDNEEVFIIIEINDERKTTLKIKMKLTAFELQSEANNKFSVNITAEKIGESKDITSQTNTAQEEEQNENQTQPNSNPSTSQTTSDTQAQPSTQDTQTSTDSTDDGFVLQPIKTQDWIH